MDEQRLANLLADLFRDMIEEKAPEERPWVFRQPSADLRGTFRGVGFRNFFSFSATCQTLQHNRMNSWLLFHGQYVGRRGPSIGVSLSCGYYSKMHHVRAIDDSGKLSDGHELGTFSVSFSGDAPSFASGQDYGLISTGVLGALSDALDELRPSMRSKFPTHTSVESFVRHIAANGGRFGDGDVAVLRSVMQEKTPPGVEAVLVGMGLKYDSKKCHVT